MISPAGPFIPSPKDNILLINLPSRVCKCLPEALTMCSFSLAIDFSLNGVGKISFFSKSIFKELFF